MTAIRKSEGTAASAFSTSAETIRPSSAVSMSRPSSAAADELLEVGRRRLRLGQHDMLALALAVVVAEDVGEDPEQPGLAVGARLEGVEEAVGAEQGVLHQVLGVLFVARHAQRGRVERAQMRERLPFEIDCLRSPFHRFPFTRL